MEAASAAFVRAFKNKFTDRDLAISIYCGTGNNGGDGLAIARLLKQEGYDRIAVRIARFSTKQTDDFAANLQRLQLTGIPVLEIKPGDVFPEEEAEVLIDALLGSGLNKPLGGEFVCLVQHLNALQKSIVAVDISTGFPAEGKIDPQETVVLAYWVISFQRPKINFFFPESVVAMKGFQVVDIGLDEEFIQSQSGGWKLVEEQDIRRVLKARQIFSHKGTYGHALIIAGHEQTMGAALLCADACLHAGAGLTTACIPPQGLTALNTRSPEVMALIRDEYLFANIDLKKYQSLAVGPGLGKNESEVKLLQTLIEQASVPLILDADALNILAQNPDWLKHLPAKSILTPHVKEFDRLFGAHNSWWKRLETGRIKATEYQLIILLKNQYSFIILPSGKVLINPTGNPAMAVGGMGDVLTGILAAFLAQGYQPEEAAMLACYLHGKAGDVLKEQGMACIPPRYLIELLPKVIDATNC